MSIFWCLLALSFCISGIWLGIGFIISIIILTITDDGINLLEVLTDDSSDYELWKLFIIIVPIYGPIGFIITMYNMYKYSIGDGLEYIVDKIFDWAKKENKIGE